MNPRLCAKYDLDGNGIVSPADKGFISANLGACEPPLGGTSGKCIAGGCVPNIPSATSPMCANENDYASCLSQGPRCDEIDLNGEIMDSFNYNYYETDTVGGLDIYGREFSTVESCAPANHVKENYCTQDELTAQVVFACDYLGRDCQNGRCVFRSGWSNPVGYTINEINACEFVNEEIMGLARQYLIGQYTVSLVEGDRVYYQNYVVLPGYLLKVLSIDSSRVKFRIDNVLDNNNHQVEMTVNVAGGVGNINLYGTVYSFNYFADSPYTIKRSLSFDFPQTNGNNKYEFYSCL